jgi:predicted secreted Zn-dependent protease
MTTILRLLPLLLLPLPAHAADWTAVEKTETYAVAGATGPELYASIGSKGPLLGQTRAIAYTTFDLKWSRDYRPQPDGSCRLVSGKPWLTITYRLPKPSQKLSGRVAENWQRFIEGMTAHEKVHGQHIKEMVDRIIATTVGVTVPDDPGCRKIRDVLQTPLAQASLEQRARSNAFDREEMSPGGNVHGLILDLVNGG